MCVCFCAGSRSCTVRVTGGERSHAASVSPPATTTLSCYRTAFETMSLVFSSNLNPREWRGGGPAAPLAPHHHTDSREKRGRDAGQVEPLAQPLPAACATRTTSPDLFHVQSEDKVERVGVRLVVASPSPQNRTGRGAQSRLHDRLLPRPSQVLRDCGQRERERGEWNQHGAVAPPRSNEAADDL